MGVRQVRRFRIEQGADLGFSGDVPEEAPARADGGKLDEVLAAIKSLQREMRDTKPAPVENHTELVQQHQEAKKLRTEIESIYQAIDRTKREIATIHEGSLSGDRMTTVTSELDAVVNGTEEATESILGAAEEIDANASDLAASLTGPQHDLANDIRERAVQLFEACNFQDLTGQRITKVVNTLKFIEDRVVRMMDIWGGIEAFKDIESDLPAVEGEEALLHGPGHSDDPDRIAQDDIDSLFD
ncbi:MAG: hypothetical protein C0605_15120 [Hyphomicrobiales bacterium]|nr:MAG: hypothetical protein C0605_15120 [Hyphomicrobiales bacterium]